jgi:hypothetical protein
MPVFKFQDTAAANAVNNNIMTGSKYEFLPRNSVVSVYAAQDLTLPGAFPTVQNMNMDFTLGNVVIGDNLPLPALANGTGPNRNEDLLAQGVGAAGDRIQIRTVETVGAPANYRVLVQINEL